MTFAAGSTASPRHTTVWIETGPVDGPVMIFVHGWPELGLVWRAQMTHFAAAGWRCVAPDMRGYGGSSIPTSVSAYALSEMVADMAELHEALGGAPAVWVGHDWGAPVVWAVASHQAGRCRGVVSLCVPHLARGFTLDNLVALVDRTLYPAATRPVGQWDYWLHHREQFTRSGAELSSNIPGLLGALYRHTAPESTGKPAPLARLRESGGWALLLQAGGSADAAELLAPEDRETMIAAFAHGGFLGPNAWYLNDALNARFAAEAPDFGRIAQPALFLHAARDVTCETVRSRLADPMRADCLNLTEIVIDAGHEVMMEEPDAVNAAIDAWLLQTGL